MGNLTEQRSGETIGGIYVCFETVSKPTAEIKSTLARSHLTSITVETRSVLTCLLPPAGHLCQHTAFTPGTTL